MPPSQPTVLLSFDVEEFDAPVSRGHPMTMEEQMEQGGRGYARVLRLLRELRVPATMFTTANFARWHPDLVRQAAQEHETASHGFLHASFQEADLASSRQALAELTGAPVQAFRRARLQPTRPEAILQAGYTIDSSENPIWLPGRYNNLLKPRTPYRKGPGGALLEVPVSASPGLRVPLFWLAMKNLPTWMVRHASQRCLQHDQLLNVFWHPWEFIGLEKSGLPTYMRKVDGEAMCDLFAQYVEWLRPRARFDTFSGWAARCAPAA